MSRQLIFLALLFSLVAKAQSSDSSNIYDRMMKQIHDWMPEAIGKDSFEKRYYCYQAVLIQNYQELKRFGVDTRKDAGFKKYYPLYLKRFKNPGTDDKNPSADESFLGQFISQRKLSESTYEITLFSNNQNVRASFIHNMPLDENELKLLPSHDNMVISYHVQTEQNIVIKKVKSVVYLR